jgi:hypothetical protein
MIDKSKEGREKMQANLAWDQIPNNHENYVGFSGELENYE